MAKIYYNKIKNSNGAFTIDDVPMRWRDAVIALLEADGWHQVDENGNIIEE